MKHTFSKPSNDFFLFFFFYFGNNNDCLGGCINATKLTQLMESSQQPYSKTNRGAREQMSFSKVLGYKREV